MEGRFRCPPEFEEVVPAPAPGLRRAALAGPGTELWLIRAPADFCPESLEGCPVPLDGCSQLPPAGAGDSDGAQGRLYRLCVGPLEGSPSSPLLLIPNCPGGHLACVPPLCGRLTISESFGPPASSPPPTRERRRRKKVAAKVTKELLEVPEVSTLGGGTQGPGPPQAAGVTAGDPEGPKRKKKKKKQQHKGEWPE